MQSSRIWSQVKIMKKKIPLATISLQKSVSCRRFWPPDLMAIKRSWSMPIRLSELSNLTAFFLAMANNFSLSISDFRPRKPSPRSRDLERERPLVPPLLQLKGKKIDLRRFSFSFYVVLSLCLYEGLSGKVSIWKEMILDSSVIFFSAYQFKFKLQYILFNLA